jgi:hypothetical protein
MASSTIAEPLAAAVSPATRWRRDRLFYGGYTLLAIVLVLAGFGRTYYFGSFTSAPRLPLIVSLHAAVYSVWMVLFAVQASLIASRRVRLHRTFGTLSVALAVAMVVAAWLVSIDGARNGWVGPREPRNAELALGFLAIPLGDLVLFVGFFAAAFHFRRVAETHKRLMLLTMAGGVMFPAVGRLPVPLMIGGIAALLIAPPLYDWLTRGRVHRVYAWGVPIVFLSVPIRLALGQTGAWQRFAAWLIS